MNFTVFWSEEAESRLAYEWLISTDRHRLSTAADRVDVVLRRDAHIVGESRSENRRIVHEPPLGIVFSVDLENRKVLVLDLWCYGLHGK
jgi:hypothetical protein